MAPTLPKGRAGSWLALGLTLLILAGAWFAVVAPLLDLHAEWAERLLERRTMLRRMVAIAGALPTLQETSAAIRAGPTSGRLLESASDAIAAATLQERLQQMASRVGATLASTEVLQPTIAGANRRVAIRVSLNAPWSVLILLLAEIQHATPTMLVEDLQIRAVRNVALAPDPPLDVTFSMIAFSTGAP